MKRLLLPALLLSLPLHAQLSPATQQHRADSGREREPDSVAVSMDPDGSHVVAWTYWQSEGSFICAPTAIYARRFDREGTPLGPPFVAVRSEFLCLAALRIGPQVEGRRLLVWLEWNGKYGGADYVVGALGPSGGVRRLQQFDVATTKAVIPLRAGGFLVVSQHPKAHAIELWGRRFDAAAHPLGRGFAIMASGNFSSGVDATETAGSALAVTWQEYNPTTGHTFIRARALGADGRPRSGILEIIRDRREMRRQRIVSDGSGRFAIVWSAVDPEVSRRVTVVQGRFYEADGTARTPVLTLTPPSDRSRHLQDVAMGDDGELMPLWRIAWEPYDQGAGLMDADGQLLDLVEPLTDRPEGWQMDSAVATDGHGRWVVAWTWLGDGKKGSPGIYTRLFTSQP